MGDQAVSRITEAARGKPCVRCGIADGTVVAAHINGKLAARLGRGMGQKPDDALAAHLCHRCHDVMDRRAGSVTEDKIDNGWPVYVLLTIKRLREDGVL